MNDLKEGYGVFSWPDGRIYEGTWKHGKQNGVGKYINAAGLVRFGEWKDGKRLRWMDQ